MMSTSTDNFRSAPRHRSRYRNLEGARIQVHRAAGPHLGTVQVAFYAATDWDPAIRAILTAPFARLPWKSRHILIQNEDDYRALVQASHASLLDGSLADPLPVEMPWLWGRRTPVTAQHFLTYRDEQASAADSTYWVPRIPHPILMLRDEARRHLAVRAVYAAERVACRRHARH